MLVFAFAGCGDDGKPFSKLSIDSRNGYLESMTEDTVKNNLKSPSSAKFPPFSEATIKDNGDNDYTINSYVDAQNSFGASLRTNSIVEIKVDDTYDSTNGGGYKYKVISCNFENDN